jgi:hypothetical protein
MAAEITLFRQAASGLQSHEALIDPIASYTTTFTPTAKGIIRVYGNAVPVVLTINSITFTVPSGGVERFGVNAGQQVTVA